MALIARRLAGSRSEITGHRTAAKHEIVTARLRALGMEFGGAAILERTIATLVEAARRQV